MKFRIARWWITIESGDQIVDRGRATADVLVDHRGFANGGSWHLTPLGMVEFEDIVVQYPYAVATKEAWKAEALAAYGRACDLTGDACVRAGRPLVRFHHTADALRILRVVEVPSE